MVEALILLLTLGCVFIMGYVVGRRHERDVAGEQERMAARIDPPNRTEGIPTNTEAAPSEVRRARWRNGQFTTRNNKEW